MTQKTNGGWAGANQMKKKEHRAHSKDGLCGAFGHGFKSPDCSECFGCHVTVAPSRNRASARRKP